ncbi:hypothetical protein REPUB_Repub06bG0045600 [Reevesia pubescens]
MSDDVSLHFDGFLGCNGEFSPNGSEEFKFVGSRSEVEESVENLEISENGSIGETLNSGRGLHVAVQKENVCAINALDFLDSNAKGVKNDNVNGGPDRKREESGWANGVEFQAHDTSFGK